MHAARGAWHFREQQGKPTSKTTEPQPSASLANQTYHSLEDSVALRVTISVTGGPGHSSMSSGALVSNHYVWLQPTSKGSLTRVNAMYLSKVIWSSVLMPIK